MKKVLSMFIIFITISMISTIVSAANLTWPASFYYNDSWPSISGFSNNAHFGPPQVGLYQDLLLCCKSGAFLNSGNSYTKINEGKLDDQTSYIVSETRRTGKYKLIYEDASGNKKEEYLYMYADEAAKTGVYNAYEQQYAFWKSPSDAKASVGGTNGCSTNSSLAGYTRGQELLTEAKTVKDYIDEWIIGDDKELRKEWDEGTSKKYLIESTDYDVVISKKTGEESIIIGPIIINYPDDKVRDSSVAEISDIWLEDVAKKDKSLEERKLDGKVKIYYKDASGNEVGIDKKTSTRGTKYYDIPAGSAFYIEYEIPSTTKIEAAGVEIKFEFLYLSGFEDNDYVGYKNASAKGQPMMNVYAIDLWKKEVVTFYKKVEEDVFDLSLKKSIVEIAGEEINNRVTVKNVDGLQLGINWNAVYNKKYNSSPVTVGDEIVYKLTIYNEGNVQGRAKTIKDYLPDGIEFKELKNTTGYTATANGQVVTLEANSDLDDIEPFNGTNLQDASKSIYIVCKVKQSAIKNIMDEDRVYDLSLDLEVNEYNTVNKEVTYKITIKNESKKETSTIQKIKQTLPEGIEFIPEENDGWTAIPNSDGSTYVYMELNQELKRNETTERYLKCKVTETESKKLRSTAEIVSMDKPDIDTKDWKKTVSIDVEKEVVPEKAKLILSQYITGIAKNGDNMESIHGETKQQFNIEKGDIIKYTIKVEAENYSGSNIVQIANILPDGLKMIPNDPDGKKELASESDNDDVTKDEYNNSAWNYNDNKENEYTIKATTRIGTPIDLYCVLTTNKEGNLKNIAEIVSDTGENINSTPANVELDKYLYEKQEDDDDWCEVTTYAQNSNNVKYSNLNIDITNISDIYTENNEERIDYTIAIKNSGNKDVYVKKLNTIFDGLVFREKTTDEGFEVSKSGSNSITLKSEDSDGVLIKAGEEKEIIIKCKYAAEDIYYNKDESREEEVILIEANILETSEKGLSNRNWSTEREAKYGYDYVEEDNGYDAKDKNAYYEYLTNIAEITEVSGGDDRDTLDWRDSDTVRIYDSEDPEDPDPPPTATPPIITPTPPTTSIPTPIPTPTPMPTPTPEPEEIKLTTTITGYVFEDIAANKSNNTNNLYDIDGEDKLLEGIKVTLMDNETHEAATLYQEWEENSEVGKYESEVRTNPTITDVNGYYSFEGLDPFKTYYVVFEYNGVMYETVVKNQNEETDENAYKINSKASELSDDRNNKNNKFAQISVNGAIDINGNITVNHVYSEDELIGSDAKLYNYNGNTGLNIYQLITEYTKQYIENNKNIIIDANGKFDYDAMYESIKTSSEIDRNDDEFESKLDFIKITKITASTENTGKLYPNPDYEKYVIDTKTGTIEATSGKTKYGYEESEEAKTVKMNLYVDGDSSAGTRGLSPIIQSYINSIEGEKYRNLSDGFYNGYRDNAITIQNFDDYLVQILDSNVEPITDVNGYNTYRTKYKEYDTDDNYSTNNGYLYYLRNEVAYLMNSNKLLELENYLDGTGYSNLKEWSINESSGESTDKYASSLEKLEGLYYVRVRKRTRDCYHYSCGDRYCSGHCWAYSWGEWQTVEYYVSKTPVDTIIDTNSCSYRNNNRTI